MNDSRKCSHLCVSLEVKINVVSMSTRENRTTLLNGQLWTMLKVGLIALGASLIYVCFFYHSEDKWHVDTSTVNLGREFRVMPFYKDLETLPDNDSVAVDKLIRVYGNFWEEYSEAILKIGPFNDPNTVRELRRFLTDPSILETQAAIDTTSGSAERINKISLELEDGFKRFHHLMPNEPVPDIILMNSAFHWAVFPREDYVAIGLDLFLGHEHSVTLKLAPEVFPQYQKLRMHPDLITANTLKGWMQVHFTNRGYNGQMLIEDMLYHGKVLWLADKCLPEFHDHLLMEWTPEDLVWASANEGNLWLELQPQDVLFETNRNIYNRWLNQGPFTRAGAVPQSSPDRLGIWMGWQMVEDYMNLNSDISIDELFDELDPTPFLKAYRPG